MAKSRRARDKAARQLVRDRERLAALSPGGTREHPIAVASAAVVEGRVLSTLCPQCDGSYRILEHTSPASGVRKVDVRCQLCRMPRTLWFRLISDDPS